VIYLQHFKQKPMSEKLYEVQMNQYLQPEYPKWGNKPSSNRAQQLGTQAG